MDCDQDRFGSYVVKETPEVLSDLDDFVYYLLTEKMSVQAAIAVTEDYDETITELAHVAGSMKPLDIDCDFGTRICKIRFRRHNYYLVYGVEDNIVTVFRMFHDLQDLDGALK